MPDHEELEMILDQLLHILEVHNYKKITPCEKCWFWGTRDEREKNFKHIRRCRRLSLDRYHDEYCSDSVTIKKDPEGIFNDINT